MNAAQRARATSETVLPERGSGRVLPIDASRGLVMLFSCLAHFAWWIHPAFPEVSATLAGIGRVATPTFLMISGAMVGMLCATSAAHGRDLKSQLFNRGLFLVTTAHLLIALAEAHETRGFSQSIRSVTVVDEIGLCTLIAAFFVPQLANAENCRRIAMVATLVLVLACLEIVFWVPATSPFMVFAEVLVGGNMGATKVIAHTPILQYLAIYALGLPLGHLFASYVSKQISLRTVATRCVSIGSFCLSAGLLLRIVRYVLDQVQTFHNAALELTLTITAKTPPSPAYLLFFVGCGLLFVGVLFRLSASSRSFVRASMEWVAVIGRASLLVFVLQYFLYWTLPDLLDIHPNKLSVLLFIGNVLLIRYIAGLWGRIRGNRWLTFGIKLRTPAGQSN
jgi:uncharacterized membrane protein